MKKEKFLRKFQAEGLRIDKHGYIYVLTQPQDQKSLLISKFSTTGVELWTGSFKEGDLIVSPLAFDIDNISDIVVAGNIFGKEGNTSETFLLKVSIHLNFFDFYMGFLFQFL